MIGAALLDLADEAVDRGCEAGSAAAGRQREDELRAIDRQRPDVTGGRRPDRRRHLAAEGRLRAGRDREAGRAGASGGPGGRERGAADRQVVPARGGLVLAGRVGGDRVGEAGRDLGRGDSEERAAVGGDRRRDPRVVDPDDARAGRGLDVDELQPVPVAGREGQVDRREPVDAVRRQHRLAVGCDVDRDRAARRLRQHGRVVAGRRDGGVDVRVGAVGDQQRIGDRAAAVVRARVVRRDDDALGVGVDHLEAHGLDRDAVVGVAVDRARPFDHGVLDRERTVAGRDAVGRGRHGDHHQLRYEPVRRGEEQRRSSELSVQEDVLDAFALLGQARRRRGRGHEHVLGRCLREHHRVGVDDEALRHVRALEDLELARLRDHDARCVGVGDVGGDPGHGRTGVGARGGRVRRVDEVRDEPAVPVEAVADDGDRLVAAAAADVEGVAALAADELEVDGRARALHVEGVVAGAAIDDHLLDVGERDVEAGAEDALVGDHERVAEVGSDHHDRVEAVAAVDPHRGVDRVADEVGAGATVDVRERRVRVVRVDLHERLDGEGVVAVLAVEPELGEVVVDHEGVVAGAAVERRREADSVREEAVGGLRRREVVGRVEAVVGVRAVAGRGEELADLERVVASAAEDRRRHEVVVEDERVARGAAVDRQAAVDRAVVVHALDPAACDRLAVRIGGVGGDDGGPERLGRAQEGVLGHVRAVDRELVQVAGVDHILDRDRLSRLAGEADVVRVASLVALEHQGAADSVLERLVPEAVVVDADQVVAVAAFDRRRAAGRADVDVVVVVVDDGRLIAAVEVERAARRGRVDEEVVLAVAQANCERVEVRVREADLDPEPGQLGRGELAGPRAVHRPVVGLQGVVTGAAVDRQQAAVDPIQGAADARVLARQELGDRADANNVVAGAGRDVRRVGGRLHLEPVVAVAATQIRDRPGARADDDERVADGAGGAAEVHVQRLEAAVVDRGGHRLEDAADLRARQPARVRGRVGRVVDVERVDAVAGLDVEGRGDLVPVALDVCEAENRPEARLAADVDGVCAVPGLDRRRADDLAHRDLIVAAGGLDRRRPLVDGVVDRHVVDLVAELHRHGGEPEVDDVAGHAARAADRQLVGGLPDELRVGGRGEDPLAARVQDRLVAERQRVLGAGVGALRAGGRRARVLRLAALVEHRADVADRDRGADGECLRGVDRERTAAQAVVGPEGECRAADDDLEPARRHLAQNDRLRLGGRVPVGGLVNRLGRLRGRVPEHVSVRVELHVVAGAEDRIADRNGLAAVVEDRVAGLLLRRALDHESDLQDAARLGAVRRDVAGEDDAVGRRRPLARIQLVDVGAVVDDDRDDVAGLDRGAAAHGQRRARELGAREGEGRSLERAGADRDERAVGLLEIVDLLAAVRDLGLAGLVGERRRAGVDRVAVLVVDLLAAELLDVRAARCDDRVAVGVEHRVAV